MPTRPWWASNVQEKKQTTTRVGKTLKMQKPKEKAKEKKEKQKKRKRKEQRKKQRKIKVVCWMSKEEEEEEKHILPCTRYAITTSPGSWAHSKTQCQSQQLQWRCQTLLEVNLNIDRQILRKCKQMHTFLVYLNHTKTQYSIKGCARIRNRYSRKRRFGTEESELHSLPAILKYSWSCPLLTNVQASCKKNFKKKWEQT